jgi:glycosyltransferase involved in cell wall biosynthesis
MNTNKEPLVSVVTITYNHELYIEKAINSVLIQDVDFDVEFIISNDASSDNSHKVILDAISKAKEKTNVNFRYYNHTENKGLTPNFIWALKQAHGKYIAIVDGDDYWTDPLKLKKQVAYMEAHPECVLTYHPVKELYNANHIIKTKITTMMLTFVFRNIINHYSKEFYESPNNDLFLLFLLNMHGEFKLIEDIKPAIRICHEGGTWSTLSKITKIHTRIVTQEQIYNFAKNTKYKKKEYEILLKVKLKLNLLEAKHPLSKIFKTLNFIVKHGYPKMAMGVFLNDRIS